jgi:bacteriocin-like protein
MRELTAQELDQVTGGFASQSDYFNAAILSFSITTIGGALLGLYDWLFG